MWGLSQASVISLLKFRLRWRICVWGRGGKESCQDDASFNDLIWSNYQWWSWKTVGLNAKVHVSTCLCSVCGDGLLVILENAFDTLVGLIFQDGVHIYAESFLRQEPNVTGLNIRHTGLKQAWSQSKHNLIRTFMYYATFIPSYKNAQMLWNRTSKRQKRKITHTALVFVVWENLFRWKHYLHWNLGKR